MAQRPDRPMPEPLEERDLDQDPFAQFARWFEQATLEHFEPEALALATASADGAPAARMVLLKGFDERGFVFLTSYTGRKGRELQENPRAAMLFHWDPPGRQIRIEGSVARVSAEENAALVTARERRSRIISMASQQSRPLASREALAIEVRRLEEHYGDGELPIPDDWGGYRLAPACFEFWQQGLNRFHDRFRYERSGDSWSIQRLYP